MMLTTCDAVR